MDMAFGTLTRIVIQRAQGNHGELAAGVDPRHARPAGVAERLGEEPRIRQLELPDMVSTAGKPNPVVRYESVGGKCGGPRPAASGAMAIVDRPERFRDFESHNAAETTAPRNDVIGFFGHRPVSINGARRFRGVFRVLWQIVIDIMPGCLRIQRIYGTSLPVHGCGNPRAQTRIPVVLSMNGSAEPHVLQNGRSIVSEDL